MGNITDLSLMYLPIVSKILNSDLFIPLCGLWAMLNCLNPSLSDFIHFGPPFLFLVFPV